MGKVMDAMNRAFLGSRPPVPALNRWNKLYAPLAWWYAAIGIHGIALTAFLALDHEAPESVAVDELMVAGPSSEETHRTLNVNPLIVGPRLDQFS